MSPEQEAALEVLNANRAIYEREYPDRWIAVNANQVVRAAARFDVLLSEPDVDAERFVFAFVSVGVWA